MKSTPILLIFDVDGTLTDSAGLTRVAYESAVQEMYGVENSANGVKPHGRTDQDIFEEILRRNRIDYDDIDAEFDAFCDKYIPHLARLLHESDKPRLLPGVTVLLNKLSKIKNVYLSLGTGNIEQGAYLKLQRHGIAGLFPVGGFGSDSADRPEIISIALRRARHHYRIPFPARSIWVIGDTPFDIVAGKWLGANTIGVATGNFDQYELSLHKPNALFQDLDDWERFIEVINERVRFNTARVRD